jgi:hypothetical protein
MAATRTRGRMLMVKRRGSRSRDTDAQAGFYLRALNAAEQLELEDAWRVEGIDDEIALLRVRLRSLAGQSPERIDLQLDLANAIARLVKTRYQISSQQKKSLKMAIAKVLEEVAVPLGIGIGVGVGGTLRT